MLTCEHFRRVPIADGFERCITCGNDGRAWTGDARRAAARRNAAIDNLRRRAERYYRFARWVARISEPLMRVSLENYLALSEQADADEREPLEAWDGRPERVRLIEDVRETARLVMRR